MKQHDLFIQNYMEFIEDDVESMSLTQIEEQITYVLKNKKKTTWESSL